MSGNLLCLIAFSSTLVSGLYGWGRSLPVLLAWGYFFGILKAHFVESSGHFIFDSATVGFYSALILKRPALSEQEKYKKILPWFVVLFAWPILMALIPLQHYLVQLVGLRGNIFWLPMLLVGAMIDSKKRNSLSFSLACLNVTSLMFAIAEYVLGVETFVPENEVTKIVYNSSDIAGGHLRIPSTFTNAHSYAGTMVASIPWILGTILDSGFRSLAKVSTNMIMIAGLFSALLGIFLAGPRSPIVLLGFMVLIYILTGRVSVVFLLIAIIAGLSVAYFVEKDERMQRFTELQDISKVQERVSLSLNSTFLDVLMDFPMGNGMGAGGTSLPYFVQPMLNGVIVLENEYARILLEQGLPGLIIFLSFVVWFVVSPIIHTNDDKYSRFMVWSFVIATLFTAWIGIGMMTSVPGTALLLLGIGYCISPSELKKINNVPCQKRKELISNSGLPAYQKGLENTYSFNLGLNGIKS